MERAKQTYRRNRRRGFGRRAGRAWPVAFLFVVLGTGGVGALAGAAWRGPSDAVPVAEAAQAPIQQVYEISEYDVLLEVRPDGSYHVRERITFDFREGTFRVATRDLPLSRLDDLGPVNVSGVGVEVEEVHSERRGGELRLRWTFAPREEPATFVLDYPVRGALRDVRGRNEVFWAAIGSQWEVPIRDVGVRVLVPADFVPDADALDLEPAGQASFEEALDRWVATFRYEDLPPRTAYQVRVAFPRVLEGRPTGLADPAARRWLLFAAFLLLGILPGAVATVRWGAPRVGEPRTAVLEPPDVSLADAAVILSRGWEGTTLQRAFPAMLIDLGRRGHVRLLRMKEEGWFKQPKTRAEILDADDAGLSQVERAFLDALREYETLNRFGEKGRAFRRATMRAVRDDLVRAGVFSHNRKRTRRMGFTALGAGLLAVPLFLLTGVSAASGLAVGAAAGAIAAATRDYVLTRDGAALRARLVAYLAGLRQRFERLARTDPGAAAALFIRELRWILIDPRFQAGQARRLTRALRKVDARLEIPDWIRDTTGERHEGSAAYVAFMPYFHTVTASTGAVAPGASGGVSAGASGGGAAGGGGGGAG